VGDGSEGAMKMRAAVFLERGATAPREVNAPHPSVGEALVRMTVAIRP
jgi:hypothetical protein